MAVTNGGSIKNLQKLSGTLPSQLYPVGSSIVVVAMPAFAVGDAANAFVEGLWWRVASGALPASGFVAVFADVTGVNQITVVVNTLVAFTASLAVGGRVVEYA